MNSIARLQISASGNYGYTRIFMYALSICAFCVTWGISLTDGTMKYILEIRGEDIPIIPGTKESLRLKFTGIPPLDYWFTIMVLFFWEALDGSHPATSLTGIYFLGQLIGLWTLVWVEGYRRGNKGLLIANAILWAFLMQNFTLACFGPIFFAIHLSTSPTSQSKNASREQRARSLAIPSRQSIAIPPSIFLGYVIPSILLSLPSPGVASYAGQQAAVAVWTPFPVWVGLVQLILAWIDSQVSLPPSISAASTEGLLSRDLKAMRPVYIFALIGSAIVHTSCIAVSSSTVLFPALFQAKYLSEFGPPNLLFPSNTSVETIGAGVLNFMQWDQWIGYLAVLVWALSLLKADEEVTSKTLILWIVEAAVASLLAGPGGAAVWLIWKRDEMVLGGELSIPSQQKP